MELTERLIIEKGLEELKKVDKFILKTGCYGLNDLPKLIDKYFVSNTDEYETEQIELYKCPVDLGFGNRYTYEITRLTPEIKQERRKKFIDSLVSKIEKENNIKLKVESYDI